MMHAMWYAILTGCLVSLFFLSGLTVYCAVVLGKRYDKTDIIE